MDPDTQMLLLAAGKAASGAVSGIVVRASAPMWQKLHRKLQPTPAKIRRAPSWKNVKAAGKNHEKAIRYLNGRRCRSVLEILAFLQAAGHDPAASPDVAELARIFKKELAKGLSGPSEEIERFADQLWEGLSATIRIQLQTLKENDAFDPQDYLLFGKITERSGANKKPPALLDLVAARSDLATSQERSDRAAYMVDAIRVAMAKTYEKILMPQVRDDHQIHINDIYVNRGLRFRSSHSIALASEGMREVSGEQDSLESEDLLVDRRFAIVGNPGAGKSTFVRHLIYSLSSNDGEDLKTAPMIVELKNYANLVESWPVALAKELSVATQDEVLPQVVRDILCLGYATVIFDGLDEISSLDQRRRVTTTIEQFARRYPLVRVIVTSREEGFLGARLDAGLFPVYELPDFTEKQVETYAGRWFSLVNRLGSYDSETRSKNFLRDSKHVHDLRTNPLLLALLCAIYDYEGYIPENRPSIYQQCADLLLERWDRQRGVPISFKASTEIRYLIQELAHHFFTRQGVQSGETEMRLKALIRDYVERQVTGERALAQQQAEDFLDYCAGRAWVLSRVGRNDRGERLFGFTHRTFMEYFAACYLVRHNSTAAELVEQLKPMITSGSSDVVPQIAIQELHARMADGIDDCFSLLIFDSLTLTRSISRPGLDFTLRSLQFMRPTPRVLEKVLIASIRCVAKNWDGNFIRRVMAIPGGIQEQLRATCRAMIDRSNDNVSGTPREAAAAGVIASLSKLHSSSPEVAWSVAFGAHLENGRLRADMSNRIVSELQDNVAALDEAFRAQYVTLSDFVSSSSPAALFNSDSSIGRRGIFFDNLLRERGPSLSMKERDVIAKYMLRDPTWVLPLRQSLVQELLGTPDRWAVSSARFSDSAESPDTEDVARFVLGLAAICASYEWEWDWYSLAAYMQLAPDDVEEAAGLIANWIDHHVVGRAWKRWFREWLSGKVHAGEMLG